MNYNKFINAITIKPIPVENKEEKPPHHYLFFSEPYPNIGIISKKKSGKTTVIYNIIKKALGKDTKVIVFCSTMDKDKNWIAIKNYVEDKGNELLTFTSIKDEEGNNKLSELMEEMKQPEEEEDELEIINENRPQRLGFKFDGEEKEEKVRKHQSKWLYPEYIIIFDDISDELKSSFVDRLSKTNRHYKAMCIYSTQYVCDISRSSMKQMDYLLLFRSFDRAKLDEIYKLADINLGNNGKEMFFKLYEHATAKPFSFLYISSRDNTFRRNFFPQYNLPNFFSRSIDILNNASTKTKNKNNKTQDS